MNNTIPSLQQLQDALVKLGGSDTEAIKVTTSTLKIYFKNPESMKQLLELSQQKEAHPYVRQLCLIFLRQYLIKLWSAYDEPTQKTFKDVMLEQYKKHEDEPEVLRALCHAIGSLSKIELGNDEWPELLQYILASLENSQTSLPLQKAAMELLSNIIEYVRLNKEIYAQTFTRLLKTQLQNQQLSLRMLAVKSLINLLQYQKITPKLMKHIQPLIPLMLQALVVEEKELTVVVFEVLCDLIQIKDFLNPHLQTLIPASGQLIKMTAPSQEDRDLCELTCFFLEQVAKYAHEQINESLLKTVLTVAFMLCEGEDEESEEESKDVEETTLEEMGESLIGYFANNLKNNLIFPIASAMVEQCLSDTQHPRRVKAGIKALGAMSQGCKDKIKPFIGDITSSILQKVQHDCRNVPMVAEQAALTFAKFSQSIVPEFLNLHAKVLPSLLHTLTETHSQSVQIKMLFAITSFCQQIIEEISESAEELLKGVVPLLDQKNPRQIKYRAVSAIEAISGAAPDKVMPYYQYLIEKMAHYSRGVRPGGDHAMSSIALQAAGRLALAAGRQQYDPFKEELSTLALEACQSKSSELKESGFNYFSKIIQLYKEELAPVLEYLVPLLISSVVDSSGLKMLKEKAARRKKHAQFSLDSDSADSDKEGIEGQFAANPGDIIEYNTPVLDEKTSAIQAIGRLCLYCTGPMLSYYDQIIEAFNRIDPHFCEQVRYQMIESYGQLIVGLQQHQNPDYRKFKRQGDTLFEGLVSPSELFGSQVPDLVQPLSPACLKLWKEKVRQHLLGVILTDEQKSVVSHALETIEETLHILGPGLLQEEDLKHLTKLFLALFTEQTNCQTGQGQQEVKIDSEDEYIDEDEQEDGEEQGKEDEGDDQDDESEADHDEDVMGATCDLLQQVGRVLGDSYLVYLSEITDQIWAFTKRNLNDHIMIIGLLADLMNTMPGLVAIFQTKYQIIEHLVSILQTEDSDSRLVRNSIFGIGVVIHRAPQLAINYGLTNFEDLLQQVYERLVKDKNSPEIKDNILGALGRIALACPETPKALNYVQQIIRESPLDGDPSENQTVLRLIVGLKNAIQENPAYSEFLGNHMKNVAGVVVKIIVDDKCDSTESARKVASKLLKELVENQDALSYIQSLGQTLHGDQKNELQMALKE